jgi:hypothetical protein
MVPSPADTDTNEPYRKAVSSLASWEDAPSNGSVSMIPLIAAISMFVHVRASAEESTIAINIALDRTIFGRRFMVNVV